MVNTKRKTSFLKHFIAHYINFKYVELLSDLAAKYYINGIENYISGLCSSKY